MATTLTEQERRTALAELVGWQLEADRDAIAKSFAFADFNAAFSTLR